MSDKQEPFEILFFRAVKDKEDEGKGGRGGNGGKELHLDTTQHPS